MTSQATFNTFGADLEKMLFLRTYPIRPKKDRGEHYAICQVFSLARRQGMTVAMFLEDYWCFESLHSDFQQPPFYQEYFERWGLDAPRQ